jgi:hypothetical protein
LHRDAVALFTIRHPVLTIPSAYQGLVRLGSNPSRVTLRISTSLIWSRQLYDWYTSHDTPAIVVDADDFMTDPSFVEDIAKKVGLNPDETIVSWSPTPEEEKAKMHPLLLKLQDTLVASQSVDAGRAAANLDLEAERKSWEAKFGSATTEMLRELVDETMPHYEHLRERKLRPAGVKV